MQTYKQAIKRELKDLKTSIMDATTKDALHSAVERADHRLEELETEFEGDVLYAVQKARKRIQEFWSGDTTRFEICRWIQTIVVSIY